MKKPYSLSLDEDVILSIKKYSFINWSQVVNTYLKKHLKKYRIELEELSNYQIKMEENETVDKCPECGLPATHPSGLCRDCYQSKLEAEG